MAQPFATRRSRQVGTFTGFWIFCIASIVVDSTSQANGGMTDYALAVGRFYTQAHRTLSEFAATATVSEWVPLLLYFLLANVGLLLSLFVLEVYAFDGSYNGFLKAYYHVVIGGVLLVLFGLAVFAPISVFIGLKGGTVSILEPVKHLFSFVLDISPQALVFSGFLVAISLLTSLVP